MKLVIVSPYQGTNELDLFAAYMSLYLEHHGFDFHIIICHQDNDLPFNPGALKNVGFLYAVKEFPESYICFHDTNVLPVNMAHGIDYSPPLDNQTFYQIYGDANCLGPIVVTSHTAFISVNGYPNTCWAWEYAGETTLFPRSIQRNIRIDRTRFVHRLNRNGCILEIAQSGRPKRNYEVALPGRDNMFVEIVNPQRVDRNGLSNCRHQINSVLNHERFTKLDVDFDFNHGNVILLRETNRNRVFILCFLSAIYRHCLGIIDMVFIQTEEYRISYWNQFLIVNADLNLGRRNYERAIFIDGEFIPNREIERAFEELDGSIRNASEFPGAFREYVPGKDNFEGIAVQTRDDRSYVI